MDEELDAVAEDTTDTADRHSRDPSLNASRRWADFQEAAAARNFSLPSGQQPPRQEQVVPEDNRRCRGEGHLLEPTNFSRRLGWSNDQAQVGRLDSQLRSFSRPFERSDDRARNDAFGLSFRSFSRPFERSDDGPKGDRREARPSSFSRPFQRTGEGAQDDRLNSGSRRFNGSVGQIDDGPQDDRLSSRSTSFSRPFDHRDVSTARRPSSDSEARNVTSRGPEEWSRHSISFSHVSYAPLETPRTARTRPISWYAPNFIPPTIFEHASQASEIAPDDVASSRRTSMVLHPANRTSSSTQNLSVPVSPLQTNFSRPRQGSRRERPISAPMGLDWQWTTKSETNAQGRKRWTWDPSTPSQARNRDNSLRSEGIEQHDFAFDHDSEHRKSGADQDLPRHDPRRMRGASIFEEHGPRRASTWTVRPHRRQSLRTHSFDPGVRRRFSNAAEMVFGSERRQSVVAKAVEDVIAPQTEGALRFYHTPSVAAFDVDIEKGPDDPDEGPVNPARNLTKKELLHQRLFFGSIVVSLNIACIVASGMGYSGTWVLVIILFFKSKDFLSVWIQIFCRIYYKLKPLFRRIQVEKKAAWILSLIPAYSESEEQIVKTLFSLRDNGMGEHKQVMCVILDGKPRPIKDHMTKVVASFSRQYVSLKWKVGTLQIDAGFVDDIPTLCIEKTPNAGKKDSLILCHDLFNFPRSNMDQTIKDLREELWSTIIPELTKRPDLSKFDLVFCTDADSTIHHGALAKLADACLADPKAIAACGFVFVEYEPGLEWSVWNLYQQFQYSFGQIVRRGAEHYVGKVTCLPGCITMIVVRPEMAGAIEKYAKPVTTFPVLRHQVQYLGTDRRLTYSMLSQGNYLHTLFVPEAGSETVAPQSLKHYLSQRRRWGSNAYFNNYFYFAGANMILITRIAALIEISRLTMVYYRVFNTGLFLYGVATHFDALSLLPLLIVSFTPSFWFAFAVAFLNDHLRANWKKLLCGFCINRCISPFMSITVFSLVAKNLGSQVWGISGVTAGTNVTPAAAVGVLAERRASMTEQVEAAKAESSDRTMEGIMEG
ncbi:hypothetical protein AC579_771 [Pseudocercospora musae]|uniref:chitin synthase n=1 Tax=Pseudocercospora musae TaxID=113226 RepID=A0A139IHP6_9PEZI|nr:hypothetical protein AC579_771 [Pseudocercospora musae]